MEDFELLDSFGDWESTRVVSLLDRAVQSAPPQVESPEYEEIPQFPRRLPPPTSRGTGRLRGKAFFLTYSQSRLPRDEITGWFSRQHRMKRLVIGQEHHQDGNLHWHVLIEYESEKDIRNPQYFDLSHWEGENAVREHPNVLIWTRTGDQTYDQWFKNHWEYCKKEDPTPYIVGEEPRDNRKRKRDEVFTEAMKITRERDVHSGMEFLEKNAPYDLVTKYEQIHRALVKIRNISMCMQTQARAVGEFPNAPTIVDNWRCLFINGPTGMGKTQWARSLLPLATVVSHRDQLKDVDFANGVIFDDFEVSHWPPTAVIHLLDWDEPRGLDVKHGHVIIPSHTKKIFTYNGELYRWLSKDATMEQQAACERRVHVVNITRSLF